MQTVNLLKAKSTLSALVEAIELGKESEIIIARNGRPAARLVPLDTASSGKRLGIAKDMFAVPDDIDADEGILASLFGGARR